MRLQTRPIRRLAGIFLAGAALAAAALALLAVLSRPDPVQSSAEEPNAKVTEVDGQLFRHWNVPRPLPDILVADDQGRPATLEEYRGKFVLLNVWGTWCAACRNEIPSLQRLNAKRAGRGLEVVMLSVDSPTRTYSLLREMRVSTLRAYTDESGRAMTILGLTALPTTLLIDPQGREVGRLSGAAAWDDGDALKLLDSFLKGTP